MCKIIYAALVYKLKNVCLLVGNCSMHVFFSVILHLYNELIALIIQLQFRDLYLFVNNGDDGVNA